MISRKSGRKEFKFDFIRHKPKVEMRCSVEMQTLDERDPVDINQNDEDHETISRSNSEASSTTNLPRVT